MPAAIAAAAMMTNAATVKGMDSNVIAPRYSSGKSAAMTHKAICCTFDLLITTRLPRG